MKISLPYLLILTLFFFANATGQDLTPPIKNYSSADYDAASQNWDIDIDKDGIVYAGNNQGLLSFDGQRWELFPLKKGSAIRSVYTSKDRVYTGSYKEFGYWSRDDKGRMEYTSLMPSLGDYPVQSEEFWGILSKDGDIYFRSFAAIYKVEHDSIRPLRNVVTNKMTVYKDKLLVAVRQDGLFFMKDNGELNALPNQEILKGKIVLDLLPQKDSLLIGTRDALYLFDGTSCKLFPDEELNKTIRDFELNHILSVTKDEFVIGTVKNGIIDYDRKSRNFKVVNRNLGLQNNTVLGMAGRDGKLWLGLDSGIDRIDLNSPIQFYTDESGELGAVYDLAFFRNKLYLASNTGIYDFRKGQLQLVEGSRGHTWNLEVLNDTLYANHNTGTYTIINGNLSAIEKRTGSFQILRGPEEKHSYLVGTYTGISKYFPQKKEISELENIGFPVKKMVFENDHTLWAVHPYDGIYRIVLDKKLDTVISVKKIKEIGGHKNFKADVFSINNQVAVLSKQKWYRYNVFKDTLETFGELEKFAGHTLLSEDSDGFWFIDDSDNSLVFTNFKDRRLDVDLRDLNQRLVKGNEKVVRANDSLYYITLKDGYARINLNELFRVKERQVIPKPMIREVTDNSGRYSLHGKPVIPYENAREITVLAALPDSDAAVMKYGLQGSDSVAGEVRNGVIKFQNLPRGDYNLNLVAVGPHNFRSGITSYHFTIAPPWYLSIPMKLVYFFLLIGLMWLIYWFNRQKLKKHQLLLEEKFEKEHRERLMRLEKERLMNEIDLKRKELANTTLMAAKKNEVLMDIQGELNKDKDKFSNQFRVKHIMSKINNAVNNKDEWKVFETNFNELHADFFRDLLEKYPGLSNKDLKLCSYLKMNLSSKEIAPLMGISVRGVEVHRYRLRKKMDLDKEENLNNFLIRNF